VIAEPAQLVPGARLALPLGEGRERARNRPRSGDCQFDDRLVRRASAAGLSLDEGLAEQLRTYYQLLAKWNTKVNLTAFRLTPAGEDDAIDRLLVEPVVAAGHVADSAKTMIDVGSGGGSPAIPIKLALQHLQLRMVEARTRKSAFLREAVRVLGLREAVVDTARFEEMLGRPELHEIFDLVSLRAVKIEPHTLLIVRTLLRVGGNAFLFAGPSGVKVDGLLPPELATIATFSLVDALKSRLVVLGRRGDEGGTFHVKQRRRMRLDCAAGPD